MNGSDAGLPCFKGVDFFSRGIRLVGDLSRFSGTGWCFWLTQQLKNNQKEYEKKMQYLNCL